MGLKHNRPPPAGQGILEKQPLGIPSARSNDERDEIVDSQKRATADGGRAS